MRCDLGVLIILEKMLSNAMLQYYQKKTSERMTELIGEGDVGDDDVFTVEEPKSQIGGGTKSQSFGGPNSVVEAEEKNKKFLIIKVGTMFVNNDTELERNQIIKQSQMNSSHLLILIFKSSVRLCRSLSPTPTPQ